MYRQQFEWLFEWNTKYTHAHTDTTETKWIVNASALTFHCSQAPKNSLKYPHTHSLHHTHPYKHTNTYVSKHVRHVNFSKWNFTMYKCDENNAHDNGFLQIFTNIHRFHVDGSMFRSLDDTFSKKTILHKRSILAIDCLWCKSRFRNQKVNHGAFQESIKLSHQLWLDCIKSIWKSALVIAILKCCTENFTEVLFIHVADVALLEWCGKRSKQTSALFMQLCIRAQLARKAREDFVWTQ